MEKHCAITDDERESFATFRALFDDACTRGDVEDMRAVFSDPAYQNLARKDAHAAAYDRVKSLRAEASRRGISDAAFVDATGISLSGLIVDLGRDVRDLAKINKARFANLEARIAALSDELAELKGRGEQ